MDTVSNFVAKPSQEEKAVQKSTARYKFVLHFYLLPYFSQKVRIWKDTGEPCDVIFGNGYGKNFFFSSYKEQTKSRTATDKVPYQQVQNANKNIGTK